MDTDKYLRIRQITGPNGFCPVSRSKFYALIAANKMPRPIKIGRISLWVKAELIAAITQEGGK